MGHHLLQGQLHQQITLGDIFDRLTFQTHGQGIVEQAQRVAFLALLQGNRPGTGQVEEGQEPGLPLMSFADQSEQFGGSIAARQKSRGDGPGGASNEAPQLVAGGAPGR